MHFLRKMQCKLLKALAPCLQLLKLADAEAFLQLLQLACSSNLKPIACIVLHPATPPPPPTREKFNETQAS